MKFGRRLVACALSVIILFGTIPFLGDNAAKAEDNKSPYDMAKNYTDYSVKEVEDIDTLVSALTNGDKYYIILTKDIDYSTESFGEVPSNGDTSERVQYKAWNTIVVQNDVILDLNGHILKVNDKSNYKILKNNDTYSINSNGVFLKVAKDAKLTLNDSAKGGQIIYDGEMIGSNTPGSKCGGVHKDYYTHYCKRDLFSVSGTLVVNGGEYLAGRNKKQWHMHMQPNGYAEQLILGTAVTVHNDGILVVKDGKLEGLGVKEEDHKEAAIDVEKGGNATVLGGLISGRWGANCLNYDKDEADVLICGGDYAVSGCERRIRQPESSDFNTEEHKFYEGSTGNIGIYKESLPDSVILTGINARKGKELTELKESEVYDAALCSVIFKNANIPALLSVGGTNITEMDYTLGKGTESFKISIVDEKYKAFKPLSEQAHIADSKVKYTWSLYQYDIKDKEYYPVANHYDIEIEGYEGRPEVDIVEFLDVFRVGATYMLVGNIHEYWPNGTEIVTNTEGIKINIKYSDRSIIDSTDENVMDVHVGDSYTFEFNMAELNKKDSSKGTDPEWKVWMGYYDPSGQYHHIGDKEGLVGTEREKYRSGNFISHLGKKVDFSQKGIYTIVEWATYGYRDYLDDNKKEWAYQAVNLENKKIVVNVGNPHNWKYLYSTATCEKEGIEYYLCTDCYSIEERDAGKASHKAGKGIYNNDEYCWYTCEWCGMHMDEKKHSYAVKSKETSCDGTLITYECARCGAKSTKHEETIISNYSNIDRLKESAGAATSHKWSKEGSNNGYNADSLFHWHYCTDCGTIEKKAHSFASNVCAVCGIKQGQLGIVGTSCIHDSQLELVVVNDPEKLYTQAINNGEATYKWYRDGDDNPVSTKKTYNLSVSDIGHYISCEVYIENEASPVLVTYPSVITDSYITVAGTKATCAKSGIVQHKICSGCGRAYDLSGNAISSLTTAKSTSHTYDSSCDSECNVCGIERNVTHSAGNWINDGEVHYKECTTCKVRLEETAHTPGELKVEAGKRCTEPKQLASLCVECAEASYKSEISSHIYGPWEFEKDSNCITRGKIKRTCTACGEAEIKEFPSIGHILAFVDETSSTCVSEGKKGHYECLACRKYCEDIKGSALKSDIIIPIDTEAHKPGDWIIEDEVHYRECECGERLDEEKHNYGEWKVLISPTHFLEGTKKRGCIVCGHTEVEIIEKLGEHELEMAFTEADHYKYCECGEEGVHEAHDYIDGVCSVCGYSLDEIIKEETEDSLWWLWLMLGLGLVGGGVASYFLVFKKKKTKENMPVEENAPDEENVLVEEDVPVEN